MNIVKLYKPLANLSNRDFHSTVVDKKSDSKAYPK